MFDIFRQHGDQGNEDDRDHEEFQVIFYKRYVAEEKPGKDEQCHPGHAADDVITDERKVVHPPDPGHERRESADERHEPGDHDGLFAVAVKKRLCPVQVFALDKAGKDLFAEKVSDPVINRVAEDCGQGENKEQHVHVQNAGGGKSTGDEKQRISGQERSQHQSRLHEDDKE